MLGHLALFAFERARHHAGDGNPGRTLTLSTGRERRKGYKAIRHRLAGLG